MRILLVVCGQPRLRWRAKLASGDVRAAAATVAAAVMLGIVVGPSSSPPSRPDLTEPAPPRELGEVMSPAAPVDATTVAASTTMAPATPTLPALAETVFKVSTEDKVVFVTVDDGFFDDWASLELMRRDHLPATAFLIGRLFKTHLPYDKALLDADWRVQDHTVHHDEMAKKNYEAQVREICEAADLEERFFGVRPTLFRPPFGELNLVTRRAVAQCGIRWVVLWNVEMVNGRMTTRHSLSSGDIVLMHFRQDLHRNLERLLAMAARSGMTVGRLEDYLRS